MPFEWKEYFELAKSLNNYSVENGFSREAILRCAIGRIYYAAYWHAQTYAIINLNFKPKGNAEDHGRLRALFKERRSYKGLGYTLGDLYGWRETSDYSKQTEDFVNKYNSAIKAAEKIYAQLKLQDSETTSQNKI